MPRRPAARIARVLLICECARVQRGCHIALFLGGEGVSVGLLALLCGLREVAKPRRRREWAYSDALLQLRGAVQLPFTAAQGVGVRAHLLVGRRYAVDPEIRLGLGSRGLLQAVKGRYASGLVVVA